MNLWGIIKGLLVHEESDLTKELSLEVDSAATTGTRTTLKSAQTANRTVSLPDATDTLMGKDTVDVMTNKSYDADGPGNVLTNIEDENIKAGAAIDASKLADGSVSNTEYQFINSLTSNAQDQLDANAQAIADHIANPTDAHDASAISNVPAGTIAATDVQSAINELDGDVQQVQLNLDNHMNDAVDAHDASAISSVPSGNLSATDVQSAVNELQSDVDTRALDTDLQNHINDAVDAHDASAISNIPAGSIVATDVQAAIDELDGDIQGHITDAVDAHDASAISNIPSGNLAATDVQSALDELQSDIDTRATTASNVGTGAGEVFKQKTGSTLELRTIKAGTNITVTNNADDITIDASGGSGANTSLSNLVPPTAINATLLPDVTATRSLGSSSFVWSELWSNTVVVGGSGATPGTLQVATTPSGVSAISFRSASTTGPLGLFTGGTSSAVPTGNVLIETGNITSGAGPSGDISLRPGTSTGVRGKIKFIDGSEGTTGHVWTSTGTGGEGGWAAVAAGANTSLSNLTATSINASLVPDSSATRSLGSGSVRWLTAHIQGNSASSLTGVKNYNSGGGLITEFKELTMPSGATAGGVKAVNASHAGIMSEDNATANATPTGTVYIESGNKTAGTGDSGTISVQTGTSSGGNRGYINLDAAFLMLPRQSADPTHPSLAAGAIYYNTSTNKIKMYNGTTWETVTSA